MSEAAVGVSAAGGGIAARLRGVVVYALLTLLCVGLYAPGFLELPPFDRDEARFAQASSQMLESGDLIDIRFQEEPRWKKPVGIYWLQSAATAAIGPDAKVIWTYRVPSLVGAVLSVLLTAWAGTRLFGPAAGALAGVMLAGCVVLGVEARMAKTDAVLLATLVAAQAVLAAVYVGRDGPAPGRGVAALFWVAAGISVLIKGPIVALVSGGTIAALTLWDRRIGWVKRLRPLMGLGIVAAIAAPWLIAIAIQTKGAFFAESVGHDMLGKVAGGQEGKGLPPGYYLGTFWITFAPWSFLTLLALPWVWARRNEAAVRFCVAWIVPTWILFEAVPTKLLHYTSTTFPAIAMLTAAAALDAFGRTEERPRRTLFIVAAALGALTYGALTLGVAVIPWLVDQSIDWAAVAMVPVVLGLFALAVRWLARRRTGPAVAAALASAAVLYGVTYQLVLPRIDGLWISRSAAAAVDVARPCPTTVVASAGYTEPSLVFLVGTRTKLGGGALAAEHIKADPACALALVEERQEAEFRSFLGGTEPRALAQVRGFNYNNGRRITLTLYGPAR
ncbi:MAG TPA: glycosyltransferase family 39 protein [Azospirillum sp.]|nr:glycosyltransferase family 39 protein [Azospirillum sp.]